MNYVTNVFYKEIEVATEKIMKKKQDSNTLKDTNVNEDEAQRKNKIPKKVRNLFRIKKKSSDSLKLCKV